MPHADYIGGTVNPDGLRNFKRKKPDAEAGLGEVMDWKYTMYGDGKVDGDYRYSLRREASMRIVFYRTLSSLGNIYDRQTLVII